MTIYQFLTAVLCCILGATLAVTTGVIIEMARAIANPARRRALVECVRHLGLVEASRQALR